MFNNQGKLLIFEDFRADRSLPKFRKPDKARRVQEVEDSSDDVLNGMFVQGGLFRTTLHDGFVNIVSSPQPRWYDRFCFWRGDRSPDNVAEPVMTVESFFSSVKDSVEQLKIVAERASGYSDAIARAKAAGQVALKEQLEKGLVAVRAETQLAAMGLGKYVTEETVVEFAKKAHKAVRIDWIANFTHMIPVGLLDKKKETDDRLIFDNYVVMHYDPKGKSWSETEAERERRKDPILFGVIDGRRLLYYVGDWVDEFCDLSLDQVADVLGKETVKTV